jgi:hypothetical protein
VSTAVPRAIYWRRRLLLLALVLLIAWVAVEFWPHDDDGKRTVAPAPSSTATAPPTPTPAPPTTPPEQSTKSVTLAGGGKACDSQKVRMSAFVADGQPAQQPVNVDLAIATTGKRACLFKPKTYDPLAIVSVDGKRVWDSSVCKEPVASAAVELVPGWSTVVRIPWLPRKSGKSCEGTEAWLPAGDYTLEVGTLGGEPGKASFELAAPPAPTVTPPTTVPTPVPTTAPAPAPDSRAAKKAARRAARAAD